jgi:hypothetical protein
MFPIAGQTNDNESTVFRHCLDVRLSCRPVSGERQCHEDERQSLHHNIS